MAQTQIDRGLVMKLKVLLARKIFAVFNGSQIMTRNMREPATPVFGWVARTLMQNGNARVAASSVQQLQILKTDSVCEVGAGSGLSLLEIVKYTSNEVYAVEISKAFRRQLRALKLAKNVSIIKNDARNLKNEISDNTIDKLLGVNLVYFLKPLNIYVDEFFRILKPGGVGLFACKFDKIQEFDDTVAPNKSEAQVITALVDAGFETTSEYIDLGDANSRFTAIKFYKPLD